MLSPALAVPVKWRVFKSGSDTPVAEALTAIASLLESNAFSFEDRDRLSHAVSLCGERACDFADTMRVLKNATAPCEYTATFDKAMRALPGVRVL